MQRFVVVESAAQCEFKVAGRADACPFLTSQDRQPLPYPRSRSLSLSADTRYRPAGQEVTPVEQLLRVMGCLWRPAALAVGPNSGYGTDNRCLLDALARTEGRLKGIAVVDHAISTRELAAMKAQGVIGIAFNTANMGCDFYRDTDDLIARLEDLDMVLQLQVEKDHLCMFLPMIERSKIRILVDHCGRPTAADGLNQPGFRELLALGRAGRAAVKLSGFYKYAVEPYPYHDAWPYIHALAQAFTLDACVWGSDWPFLRAPERMDLRPDCHAGANLFPDATDRRKLFWETPARLFGFPA